MDIVSIVLSYLLLYKYIALFTIAFLGAFLLPVPSSITLAAASAFASQGYFNFYLVFLVALAGNLAGDNLGYFLASRYGQRFLERIGFNHILRLRNYHALEEYVKTYPGSLIYFSRFLTEVDPAVNVLAGLVGIPWRTYFLYDFVGEFSYVALYSLTGYLLGNQWENNAGFFTKSGLVMLLLGAVIMLIQGTLFYHRVKKKKPQI